MMCDDLLVQQDTVGRSKVNRGHTDLNHGPIGLQPIALPLSYIPKTAVCGHKTGNIC